MDFGQTLNTNDMRSRKNKRPDQTQDDRERNEALNKSANQAKEEKLPGDYPSKEDIMNRLNTQRVGMNVENFSRAVGPANLTTRDSAVTRPDSIQNEPMFQDGEVEGENRADRSSMEQPVPRNVAGEDSDEEERSESDVTDDDLDALGPKDLSMDMGDDEQLKNRVWPVDMAGSDLDVPGSELDDENEAIGSEDEENNSYSLGGDGHEDNMEGK